MKENWFKVNNIFKTNDESQKSKIVTQIMQAIINDKIKNMYDYQHNCRKDNIT